MKSFYFDVIFHKTSLQYFNLSIFNSSFILFVSVILKFKVSHFKNLTNTLQLVLYYVNLFNNLNLHKFLVASRCLFQVCDLNIAGSLTKIQTTHSRNKMDFTTLNRPVFHSYLLFVVASLGQQEKLQTSCHEGVSADGLFGVQCLGNNLRAP